ncbi:MAG TPA: sigma-70 family RNA polymerase sigma factor, partial [Myxococcales bacterium]|nr:sigma-70 family RNA polymerase sigma factor [Myxococcales bacterium]
LLQRARTALARGEAREALALLDDHQRLFPGGQLIESREALRIEALAAAGESARARALADEYRRRFPHSVFLPVVNRAAAGK